MSPIVSYQPSLLATQKIGPGRQGSMFEAGAASAVMADLSHLGLIHKKGKEWYDVIRRFHCSRYSSQLSSSDTPTFSLIRLPKSFVELYGIVNKVKGRDETTTLDDSDDVGNSETAICLLTGAVMRSGSSRRPFHRSVRTFHEYQSIGDASSNMALSLLIATSSWSMYSSCQKKWFWDRYFLSSTEMYGAFDAQ